MNPTNSLSVNSLESLSQNETLVTTKELAVVLAVPKQTIANTVKKLDKVLGQVKKNNQNGYLFNEAQATLIKQEIQKHHNLASRKIDSVSTDLEMEMLTQKVIAYHIQKANEYKAKIEVMQPKAMVYDDLVDRNKCINFRDMASKIGFTQNEFMTILKSKYIYKNSIGEYRAYSDYQDLFSLRTYAKGVDQTGEQLMLNMKGITYFCKKFGKNAIAESFVSKGEKEYQEIIDDTAEKIIDSDAYYSLEEVASLSNENKETILNFLKLKGYLAENNLPNYYSVSLIGYFKDTNSILFTEHGKNKIVSVFTDIKNCEKGLKKSSLGKSE